MDRRRNNIIIASLIIVAVLMSVGYAAFSSTLKINTSGSIATTWRVEFSAIRTKTLTGGATNKSTPTASGTLATFNVDLVMPGDEVTYEIDITNYGTLDAEIQGASYTVTGSEDIYIRLSGIKKGDVIKACTGSTCNKLTLTLSVGYNPLSTGQATSKTKTIEVTIKVGQYSSSNPTPPGELVPELQKNYLVQQILKNNTVLSDSNINFKNNSSASNGKGLYYTTKGTANGQPTYYFRGAVTNNYVKFAGLFWRIVRINEDGTIRLIYQGTTATASGASSVTENSAFNSYDNQNGDVGYMMKSMQGQGSSYDDENANVQSSTIKGKLDAWYTSKLASNSSYLADSGFCNDRSIYQAYYGKGYSSSPTTYAAKERLQRMSSPSLACKQKNDLFTVNNSLGNRDLTSPIGLITVDELVYAGYAMTGTTATDSYLHTATAYWTMSPYEFTSGYKAFMYSVNASGYLYNTAASTSIGVRPVINLRADVELASGIGTSTSPYEVKLS